MPKININDIQDNIIGRTDSEKFDAIVQSIREKGLLQPIIITRSSDHYKLVTGKLRLAACKKLGWETITCSISKKDDPDTRLHENLKRKHLSWDEEARLTEELHTRKQQKHGVPVKGKKNEKQWTVRDTARELGRSLGSVSENINLAKAVKRDPSLSKVKDRATAIKIVRLRKKQDEQESVSLAPLKIDAYDEIFCGDSREILKRFPNDTFHCVITDPPWLKFAGHEELTSDTNTLPTFRQLYRVMGQESFLYAFVGFEDFFLYRKRLPKFGFVVQSTPLIWHKRKFLSRRSTASWYGRDYELILVAVKGKPVLYEKTYPNSVISCDIVHPSKLTHPNEKPKEIIRTLLDHSTVSGNLILDPFAGSFVVPEVCVEKKRHFVGIERSKEYYEQGKERLGL